MKTLLELDLRLLILRYGRQPVLKALAGLGDQTAEQLEQQLRELEQKPRRSTAERSKLQLNEVVASECKEHPEKADFLRSVAVNFENRTFLPQLRDVQRFLDRIGASARTLKSRAAAGPVLIHALSKLPREELLKVTTTERSPHEGDYSLLTQAIMGTLGEK